MPQEPAPFVQASNPDAPGTQENVEDEAAEIDEADEDAEEELWDPLPME